MYRKFKIWMGLVITFVLSFSALGGVKVRADQASDFITQLSPVVKDVSKKYNLYPSLMLSQAALESSYGQSSLSTQANNYFGIKGSYNGQSVTLKTAEYDSSGNIYYTNASFKKYPNAQSSLEDYAQLIRNGLVGAASFYSGTWKENAKSVNDAATALVGKYATDPNYGNKLIQIINQYNLTSLDGGITEQSNTVANNASSSASSSASANSSTMTASSSSSASVTSSSPSVTSNNFNSNQTTSTTTAGSDQSANNVKVSYYLGDANDKAALSTRFRKQVLYSGVEGATQNLKNYKWKANLRQGNNVYVDSVGYAKGDSGKQTWYRIRFAKKQSAKKYWVKSQALSFPNFKYFQLNTSIDSSLISKKVAYNHIYGSSTLSTKLIDADMATRVKYNVNMIGISGEKNNANVWMRYKMSNGKNAWIKMKHVNGIQELPVDVQRSISSQYSQYSLYSELPQNNDLSTNAIGWNTVSESTISKVNVDSFAIDANNKTIWAHIQIGKQKYWINNSALY